MKLVPDPTRTGSARLDSPWSEPPRTCDCRPRTLPFTITFSIALLHRHNRVTRLAYLCLLRYASCENSRSSLPRSPYFALKALYLIAYFDFTFLDETPCEISTCPTCRGCSGYGCISAGPTSTVNLPRSFSSIVCPPSSKLCPFGRETTSPSDLCPPIPSFHLDNSATRSRRPFAPPVPTLSPFISKYLGEGRWNRVSSIETDNNRRKFARSTIDPHSRCPGIRFLSAFLHPPVTRFLRSAQHRVHSILSWSMQGESRRRVETIAWVSFYQIELHLAGVVLSLMLGHRATVRGDGERRGTDIAYVF